MESNTESEDQKVQAIFDKVITAGLYPVPSCNISFMCEALWCARFDGCITKEEETYAIDAIRLYLNGQLTLSYFLNVVLNLSCTIEDRLKIYQNWANRPQPIEG
jgi:hypothetical protein